MKIYSAKQMKEADTIAIKQYGIDGLVLMENAAGAIKNEILRLENIKRERILIVCGRGNNGGDGFAVARRLIDSFDDVCVAFFESESALSHDAAKNYEILKKLHINIIDDVDKMVKYASACDVIVDALYGFGFRGELCERDKTIVEAINSSGVYVLSVDVPSGVSADEGECNFAVHADKTVTFTGYKIAQLTFPAASYCGEVVVCDIGVPDLISSKLSLGRTIDAEFVKKAFLPRGRNAHKGSCGKVFVVGGSTGMSGAVCMSAMAAMRSGAGLVTAGVPKGINDIFEKKVTEAMSLALEEENGAISKKAAKQILEFARGCDTLVIGPGMGRGEGTEYILRECLATYDKNIIIDADALFALSLDTSILDNTKANVILTPHHAEMGRLVGKDAGYVEKNAMWCAREFACKHNVTVILKGAYTVIAGDGELYVNNNAGNQGMATGGSGDVLGGVIGALACVIDNPTIAAVCGVYIHALAGDVAKEQFGTRGMLAGDISDALPKVFCEFLKDNK